MIMSMTGFGTSTLSIPVKDTVLYMTLSLKTLNSRFFESTCKLPYALTELETIVLKIFKAKLFRGTLYFSVHVHNPSILKGGVTPSLNMINQYLAAIETIKKHTHVEGTIALHDLITLPSIFEIPEEMLPKNAIELILQEIDKLIQLVIASRQQEGQSLQNDLEQRVHTMNELMSHIEPRAQKVLIEKKQTISATFAAMPYQEASENREQHILMLYGQLDKIDIHEEIFRFKTHLAHFEKVIHNADQEKGKKLDFILQEMFREINTMNAKCSDSQISEYAISLKVELEKAREQVQNIV
ncbi:MAG: YicC family protein [Candidatus Babeliaceae bacterium]|nr:YicC family protein [Candidatus Babeliaceae bacterium]